MVSFLSNNFSRSTSLFNVLCSTTGIGRSSSVFLCRYVGVSCNMPIGEAPRTVLKELHRLIVQFRVTGSLLRRLVLNNVRRKAQLKSHQGRRHLEGLPVRGQNSKSNARTARMLRKTKNSILL